MGGKTGNPTLKYIFCIDFRGFENTKACALWRCVVCAALSVVWLERSTIISLRGKVKSLRVFGTRFVFFASFWVSVSPFKEIPVFLIARDWRAIYRV